MKINKLKLSKKMDLVERITQPEIVMENIMYKEVLSVYHCVNMMTDVDLTQFGVDEDIDIESAYDYIIEIQDGQKKSIWDEFNTKAKTPLIEINRLIDMRYNQLYNEHREGESFENKLKDSIDEVKDTLIKVMKNIDVKELKGMFNAFPKLFKSTDNLKNPDIIKSVLENTKKLNREKGLKAVKK